jgi:hypothetical protein
MHANRAAHALGQPAKNEVMLDMMIGYKPRNVKYVPDQSIYA